MLAKKKNKTYTISEVDKTYYIKLGYNIYNDEGELIVSGKGNELEKDNIKLTTKNAALIKSNEDLTAKVAELETANTTLTDEKVASEKTIEKLTAKVAELETAPKKGDK